MQSLVQISSRAQRRRPVVGRWLGVALACACTGRARTGSATVSVWTDEPYRVDVAIDGRAVGRVPRYFSRGGPSCGQVGTLSVRVGAGDHAIAWRAARASEWRVLHVGAGECVLVSTPVGTCRRTNVPWPRRLALGIVGVLDRWIGSPHTTRSLKCEL